jgi:hypothetical protein
MLKALAIMFKVQTGWPDLRPGGKTMQETIFHRRYSPLFTDIHLYWAIAHANFGGREKNFFYLYSPKFTFIHLSWRERFSGQFEVTTLRSARCLFCHLMLTPLAQQVNEDNEGRCETIFPRNFPNCLSS